MLGADVNELLKALEEVGLSVDAPISLLERLRALFFDVTGPLLQTLELVDDALDLLFNVEFTLPVQTNVARLASLDLELLQQDIETIRILVSVPEQGGVLPGRCDTLDMVEARRIIASRKDRLEEIIQLLDVTARALEEATPDATTIADRIAQERLTLDQRRQALGNELDRALQAEEPPTTGVI